MDVDGVPTDKTVLDLQSAGGIGALQISESLIGEHDAPSKRVVAPVAFDDSDPVRRIAPHHLDREVQARRPAAGADDPHA